MHPLPGFLFLGLFFVLVEVSDIPRATFDGISKFFSLFFCENSFPELLGGFLLDSKILNNFPRWLLLIVGVVGLLQFCKLHDCFLICVSYEFLMLFNLSLLDFAPILLKEMVVYVTLPRVREFVEVVEVDLGTVGVHDLNPLTCRFGDGKVH